MSKHWRTCICFCTDTQKKFWNNNVKLTFCQIICRHAITLVLCHFECSGCVVFSVRNFLECQQVYVQQEVRGEGGSSNPKLPYLLLPVFAERERVIERMPSMNRVRDRFSVERNSASTKIHHHLQHKSPRRLECFL